MYSFRTLGRKATAQTVTFTTADIKIGHQFTSIYVWVKTTAVTGTSPTLNLILQRAILPPAAVDVEWTDITGTTEYQDYAAFSQITGNTERAMSIVGSANQEFAVTEGTLTAGTILDGAIPPAFRFKGVIGGTSPNFTVQIVVQFIP